MKLGPVVTDLEKRLPTNLVASTNLDDILMIEFCVGRSSHLEPGIGVPGMRPFNLAGGTAGVRESAASRLRDNLSRHIQASSRSQQAMAARVWAIEAGRAMSLRRPDLATVYAGAVRFIENSNPATPEGSSK